MPGFPIGVFPSGCPTHVLSVMIKFVLIQRLETFRLKWWQWGRFYCQVTKEIQHQFCCMSHRTPLVPVISFGETDVYDQLNNPEGSWLRWAQELCRRVTGIAPVALLGRGLFQYSFGVVPLRRPVTTVGNVSAISEHDTQDRSRKALL